MKKRVVVSIYAGEGSGMLYADGTHRSSWRHIFVEQNGPSIVDNCDVPVVINER